MKCNAMMNDGECILMPARSSSSSLECLRAIFFNLFQQIQYRYIESVEALAYAGMTVPSRFFKLILPQYGVGCKRLKIVLVFLNQAIQRLILTLLFLISFLLKLLHCLKLKLLSFKVLLLLKLHSFKHRYYVGLIRRRWSCVSPGDILLLWRNISPICICVMSCIFHGMILIICYFLVISFFFIFCSVTKFCRIIIVVDDFSGPLLNEIIGSPIWIPMISHEG